MLIETRAIVVGSIGPTKYIGGQWMRGLPKILAGLLYPISLEAIMCLDEKISSCFTFYHGWECAKGLIFWTPLTTNYPSIWWPSGLVNVLVEQVDSSLVLQTTLGGLLFCPYHLKSFSAVCWFIWGNMSEKTVIHVVYFFILVFPSAV